MPRCGVNPFEAMLEKDHDTSNSEALREEARAWLRRLTSGIATPDDIDALERWRSQGAAHAQAFAEAAAGCGI